MSDAPSQPQGASAIIRAEEEKRAERHRDLVRCFKRVFNSTDGRRVLEFLERAYNFDNDEYVVGMTQMDLAYRNAVKSPIRCIRKLRDTELPPLGRAPRKMKARS